jgi:hypothetical protein
MRQGVMQQLLTPQQFAHQPVLHRDPRSIRRTANGRLRNPCHDRPAQQRAGTDPRVNTGEDSLVQRPRPAGGALVATSPRPDYSCLRNGIGKYDGG